MAFVFDLLIQGLVVDVHQSLPQPPNSTPISLLQFYHRCSLHMCSHTFEHNVIVLQLLALLRLASLAAVHAQSRQTGFRKFKPPESLTELACLLHICEINPDGLAICPSPLLVIVLLFWHSQQIRLIYPRALLLGPFGTLPPRAAQSPPGYCRPQTNLAVDPNSSRLGNSSTAQLDQHGGFLVALVIVHACLCGSFSAFSGYTRGQRGNSAPCYYIPARCLGAQCSIPSEHLHLHGRSKKYRSTAMTPPHPQSQGTI